MGRKNDYRLAVGAEEEFAIGFPSLELKKELPGFAGRPFHGDRTTRDLGRGQGAEQRLVKVVAPRAGKAPLPPFTSVVGKLDTLAPEGRANGRAPRGRDLL